MYKVYSDDILIHDSKSPSKEIHLIDPTLKLLDSSAGTFEFTVPSINPGYNAIDQRLSTIKVYRDNKLIWTGRVITENEDFWKRRKISCEGALAFLNDVSQVHHNYSNSNPSFFLRDLIAFHNSRVAPSRQFRLGIVTVTDLHGDGIYKTDYENTLEAINKNLLEPLGGHILVTYGQNDDTPVLNYIRSETFNTSHQVINFGENLLDFTKDWDLSDLCTVLIPRGKRLEEDDQGDADYVTIASVNGGSIYLRNTAGIDRYGVIEKTVDFSDVEDPATLKELGLTYMSSIQFNKMTLKVTAIDLHALNPEITPFNILEEVQCVSPPHGLNKIFPITEIDLPLDKPDSVVYTLGQEPTTTMSTQSVTSANSLAMKIDDTAESVLTLARQQASSLINSATTGYVSIVTENDAAQALLITNTQDPEDATKIWRWNLNGLGYSNDGGESYRIAITMDGSILADFITTGVLNADLIQTGTIDADLIKTGIIQDVLGKNYWNLDTGELVMDAGVSIGGLTADEIAELNADAAINTFEYNLSVNGLRRGPECALDWVDTDGKLIYWFGDVPYPRDRSYADQMPSAGWTTDEQREAHVGDGYYSSATEKYYEYQRHVTYDPTEHRLVNLYEWVTCRDQMMIKLIDALLESDRIDDGKVVVFTTTPVPPYSRGDIWFTGENQYALVTLENRATGAMIRSDWIETVKFTDDGGLHDFIEGEYADDLASIQGQIDRKADTWYQGTDPSLNWAEADKSMHAGDLWYNTTNNTTWRYNGSAWQQQDVPDAVFDKIDGKAQIFIRQPVTPYHEGDLWFDSANSDILTCVADRETGSYVAADWQKRNRYTDDSSLTNFINGLYVQDKASILSQVDQKAETWYQNTDPSTNWDNDEKPNHTGDLWYRTTDNTTWRYSGLTWLEQDVPTDVFDAIDGKAQIFVTQPVPPYNVGDLWFNSATSDIMTCTNARVGGNFTASDWEKRNKYTDDSALTTFVNGSYANDIRAIGGQLDQKAETWYQETDPATSWTASQKAEHVGDLWYRTTDNTTWRYNGSTWLEQAAPDTVFDAIDGKAAIFINQPTTPYHVGDLWFNSSTSDIMTCITERLTGSFTAADWEKRNKYTDDTAVTNLDNLLTPLEIFNRLTNNGAQRGIYMENGNIYINGTYIKSGIIDADLLTAGTISDRTGTNTWDLETGTLTIGQDATIAESGMTIEELVAATEPPTVRVFTEYGLSESPDIAPSGALAWSSTPPEWKFGYSMWTRTGTVVNNDTDHIEYSTPKNVSKGDSTQLTVKGVKFLSMAFNETSGDPFSWDLYPPDKSSSEWQTSPPSLPRGQIMWAGTTYANDRYLTHRTYMKANNNVNALLISCLVSQADKTQQVVFYVDGRRIYKTYVMGSGVNPDFETTIGYMHLCWGFDTSGSGFSKTPVNAPLIGYFLDSNQTDSGSDKTKYNWSLTTSLTYAWDEAVHLQSATTQYYLSTSSSVPADGEWLDTVPNWIQGRYYWTRTKTVVGNDRERHTDYSDPVLAKGMNKANEAYTDAATALNNAATANQNASTALNRSTTADQNASTALSNANDAMAIAQATQAVIRILTGGILVTKAGYTIGAYVNGSDGCFDIVPVTWTNNSPTVGSYAFARYGAYQQIGKTTESHVYIDSTGMKFYGKNSNVSSPQLMGHIGFGTTLNNAGGNVTAPYYTFGTRTGNVGEMSVILGNSCQASRAYAIAEGHSTVAGGYASHAEGYNTKASANTSHAEGSSCTVGVGALSAHAEGASCTIGGMASYSHVGGNTSSVADNCVAAFAHGYKCKANASYSHATGNGCTVSAESGFAHGEGCQATGKGGAAFGWYTKAGYYQLACGSKNSTVSSSSGSVYYYFTVGIGSSSGSDGFTVNSNGNCWGVSWSTGSDRRIKNHIDYLDEDDASDFIYGLKPVLYTLKMNGDRHVGFYAQDVEEVEPWDANIVTEEEHGGVIEGPTKNLDYQALIAPLVSTVQKQHKTIEEQQKKIESLEERLATLEKIVASMAQ